MSIFVKGAVCFAGIAVMFATVGCTGGGRRTVRRSANMGRVDMDKDDALGGTGVESGDIRSMCDKFVRSLLDTPQIANADTPPRVAILPVKNHVTDASIRFDSDILLMKMRSTLNKAARGKILFLARENLDATLAEKKAMDEGKITRSSKTNISGADYFMTGTIRSLSKRRGSGKSTYMLFAFRLQDSQSTIIVWEDDYEMKRVGLAGTIYN